MTPPADHLVLQQLADRPDGVETCADWALATWGASWGHSRERTLAWLENLLATDGEVMFVASLDNQIVGMAGVERHDLASRPDLSPWLANVFVDPDFRRRGIASALVTQVERWVWARGHRRLYLFTPDQMALYQQLDWQLTSETDHHNGAQVRIMRKDAPAEN